MVGPFPDTTSTMNSSSKHNVVTTGPYNPFPTYPYTGSVRPVYPLSPRRPVPKSIKHPDWAETGIPEREMRLNRSKWDLLDVKGQEGMRKVCRLAREVLDITAAAMKPGVTTDYLDEICHNACVERDVSEVRSRVEPVRLIANIWDSHTRLRSITTSFPSPCVHLRMRLYATVSRISGSFLMAIFSTSIFPCTTGAIMQT